VYKNLLSLHPHKQLQAEATGSQLQSQLLRNQELGGLWFKVSQGKKYINIL
jgi:hypothetical protein